MTALFRRIAGALGWTPGQAWTVAVGLVVAVPAALFGLGPSLNVLRQPARALAAASPAAATPPPATQAPSILGNPAPPAATPAGRTSSAATGAPSTGVRASPSSPVP